MAFRATGLRSALRSFSTTKEFSLPSLPYEYGALEPYISSEIMKVHHQKHHQTYVNTLNTTLKQIHEAESKGDFNKVIGLQQNLKFNYGGHVNHSIFWQNLAPASSGGGGTPGGNLAKAIEKNFGSFDKFQEKFNAASLSVQGSGWAWLGFNKQNGALEITTKPNQDPLIELTPLLGFDVWEHAYYLQYKNVRADYLKQIWNVVNWKDVSSRLAKAHS